MSSASALLWQRLDATVVAECGDVDPFRCWVCAGAATRGVVRERWQGANFTGQNKVRAPESSHVCEPCVFVMAGRPPDTLRMYSHLFDVGGEYLRLNKGNKPAMRAFLRRHHAGDWFAAIADSGQKHIVPWAPINPAGTRRPIVLFEETLVTLPAGDAGWTLVDRITALLTAGATKEEIDRGEYGQRAHALCHDAIETFEESWSAKRASPWFSLAVWLSQRDEQATQARLEEEKAARAAKKEEAKRARPTGKGAAPNRNRRTPAPGKSGVSADQRSEHSEALRSDPGSHAGSGAHVDEPGGVGHAALSRTEAGGAQRSFFDLLDGPRPPGT